MHSRKQNHLLRSRHISIVLTIGLLTILTKSSAGVVLLDQTYEIAESIGAFPTHNDFTPAQLFTVEAIGLLSRIDLQIRRSRLAGFDASLEIWAAADDAPTGTEPLFSTAIPFSDIPVVTTSVLAPFTFVDVATAGLQVSPGEQFMLAFRRDADIQAPSTSWARGLPGYTKGESYFSSSGNSWESVSGNADLAFRTWVDAPEIGVINGDFNDSGTIDGQDFLIWQRGRSPSSISSIDLARLKANYGALEPLPSSARLIPEPTSFLMMAIACFAKLACRQRKLQLRCQSVGCVQR